MPQFDFSTFVPQVAWLAVFFAILYFGIVRTTLPRLARLVDERQGKVTGDIGAADMAKAEADRVHDAYVAEMARAHADAQARVVDAKDGATRDAEARLHEADAALEQKQHGAFAALEQARASALSDIEGAAADAAADIVDRLGGERPAPDAARAAARRALAA